MEHCGVAPMAANSFMFQLFAWNYLFLWCIVAKYCCLLLALNDIVQVNPSFRKFILKKLLCFLQQMRSENFERYILRRCSESLLLKYDNPLKSGAISHKTSTRPEHKRKRKHCKTETKKNISSWLAGSAPQHTSGRFYNWFWMGARAIIYAKSEVEKTLENLQKKSFKKTVPTTISGK